MKHLHMVRIEPLQLGLGLLLGYALKWVLDQSAKSTQATDKSGEVAESRAQIRLKQRAPAEGEEVKMVLVVNESLKMGKGKIGAQCAHAAVGLLEELEEEHEALVEQWEESGQAKVCLKCPTDEELTALAEAAEAAGIPSYQVLDQGRTQIPAGSRTVLAIGPAPKSQIDSVTGHLKLL